MRRFNTEGPVVAQDHYCISGSANTTVAGGSAFNIKAASLRLGDFTQAEMRTLLAQHTEETGQAFTPEAVARCGDRLGASPGW